MHGARRARGVLFGSDAIQATHPPAISAAISALHCKGVPAVGGGLVAGSRVQQWVPTRLATGRGAPNQTIRRAVSRHRCLRAAALVLVGLMLVGLSLGTAACVLRRWFTRRWCSLGLKLVGLSLGTARAATLVLLGWCFKG